MRIISGKLKGVEIPFINQKYDNANATPQRIKKALFSIIGEDLTGKSFLDLYSCSGQIGIEALSRNAGFVVFNEIDHKRFLFIKSIIKKLDLDSSSLIVNYHAFRCMRYLDARQMRFDHIFIDAPYSKSNKNTEQYDVIINELKKYNILKENGRIIIQHLSNISLSTDLTIYRHIATKKYSKNSLSIFEACKGGLGTAPTNSIQDP